MIWDSEKLFEKSAVYLQRAYAGDREGDDFPLGISMGFELLARSALARIHPVLLADPQQGENLLYAFGYPSKKPPRSVPLKTVLHRLTVVVENFTDEHFKVATSVLEMRNAEVHSADLPFDTIKTHSWLPKLLETCQILCFFLEKNLSDLLGPDDAKAAEEMILALQEELKSDAHEMVSEAKKVFEAMPTEERLERLNEAKRSLIGKVGWRDKTVECPSCGAHAILRGKLIRLREAKATTDGIEETAIIMPASLECFSCRLELSQHGHLFHLGFGDQYSVTTLADPKDYFGIEFDPADYFESDYGND